MDASNPIEYYKLAELITKGELFMHKRKIMIAIVSSCSLYFALDVIGIEYANLKLISK